METLSLAESPGQVDVKGKHALTPEEKTARLEEILEFKDRLMADPALGETIRRFYWDTQPDPLDLLRPFTPAPLGL